MRAAEPGSRAWVVRRLRAAGCVYAEDEADLLMSDATDLHELDRMVSARAAGSPVEQVLGWAAFCGRPVGLRPGVFVPRRRTEVLAAEAVRLARPGAVVVDLCCGSGAIALTVALGIPGAEVHAADVDPLAVACARDNLVGLGAGVHLGDLYDALPPGLRRRVDVLAANAPYVPSGSIASMPREARDHGPLMALDGGPDGLDVQRRVVDGASAWLSPHSSLLLESSLEQAPATEALMAATGLRTRVVRSDALDGTVVIGARG